MTAFPHSIVLTSSRITPDKLFLRAPPSANELTIGRDCWSSSSFGIPSTARQHQHAHPLVLEKSRTIRPKRYRQAILRNGPYLENFDPVVGKSANTTRNVAYIKDPPRDNKVDKLSKNVSAHPCTFAEDPPGVERESCNLPPSRNCRPGPDDRLLIREGAVNDKRAGHASWSAAPLMRALKGRRAFLVPRFVRRDFNWATPLF
ncbi:hypothetical protein NPIL_45461 [Nephila pilipes]|uniref:Uncharacterized protein n=1 Tax=Nephila pilipes TaxID=299642 RepID=A0A8X6P207_NEPPI|nr:hypothetical protein NPIL_45461 [Nephila pilipes]